MPTLTFKMKVFIWLNQKKAHVKPRSLLKATCSKGAGITPQSLGAVFGPGKAELNFLFCNACPMHKQGSSEAPLTHHFSALSVLSQPSKVKTVTNTATEHREGLERSCKTFYSFIQNHDVFSKPFLLLTFASFFGGLLIKESDGLNTMVVVTKTNGHQ